jgi:membrane fusion protein, multidrug efflux system
MNRIARIVIPLALLGFLASGCGGEKGQAGSRKAGSAGKVPVTALVIKPQAIENTIVTTGTLLANEEVELRPEISGRVVGIYFQEGSWIKQGALMLKIDDGELKAQLKGKQAEEKLASDEEARRRTLFENQSISQEEYDRAAYALKMIQSEREVIESRLAKTEIVAPFDGMVGLRYVSSGSNVSFNMLVTTLQDTDPMKVEFSVPEKYAKHLGPGMEVVLQVGDSPKKYRGTVFAVESKIDISTRTIKARARISNPARELVPGSFAKVELTLERVPQAIVVPSQAVIPEMSGEKVFICANGTAQAIPVKVGIRTESLVQITEGLHLLDTLILTGLLQLADGSPVDIKHLQSE